MAKIKNIIGMVTGRDDDDFEEEIKPEKKSSASYSGTSRPSSGKSKGNFVLYKPSDKSVLYSVADDVIDGKSVILNLMNIQKSDVRKMIDFLSGVAYSLEGQVKEVAENTFLVTPGGIDVSGEIADTTDQFSF